MAKSTGIVLAIGGITMANEVIFAPIASPTTKKNGAVPNLVDSVKTNFNWRVIPATLGLAAGLAGLEHLAPGFAVGLAWLSLVAVLTVKFGNAPTPLDNFLKIMGYAT